MQELKKIEQRKKEREKKALDLQKLITAADSNIEARRPERKTTKKTVVCKVKDTNVSCKYYFKTVLFADINCHVCTCTIVREKVHPLLFQHIVYLTMYVYLPPPKEVMFSLRSVCRSCSSERILTKFLRGRDQ